MMYQQGNVKYEMIITDGVTRQIAVPYSDSWKKTPSKERTEFTQWASEVHKCVPMSGGGQYVYFVLDTRHNREVSATQTASSYGYDD